MGKVKRMWQDREHVLSWFGRREREAVAAYRAYLEEGVPLGRRPELVGGGLIRSLGGWSKVKSRRSKAERMIADERVLGEGAFVEAVLGEAAERVRHQLPMDHRMGEARRWMDAACKESAVSVEEIRSGGRRGPVTRLRKHLALLFITELGLPQADAARLLGVTTAAIAKILVRAGQE
jgi:hypothetical protein